jgi:hypothetical protein
MVMQHDAKVAPAAVGGDDATVREPAPPTARPRRPTRRRPTPESLRLLMLGAVARQVDIIETRLASAGAEVEERDSRILGNLAKTLATLLEIGEGGTRTKDNPKDREPTDRGDAEARLAERLKAWARGGS